MMSPTAGLCTSKKSVVRAATQRPPMKLSSVRMPERSATAMMGSSESAHYMARLLRKEDRLRFARPAFFPRRPCQLPRAVAQALQRLLVGGERFEQVEQDVSELRAVGKQQPVVAVAHAFGETGAVVERAHRHAGAEEVGDLHRDVEARRRAMEAQPEIRAAHHARIVFRFEEARAQLDAPRGQPRETTLELGPAGA